MKTPKKLHNELNVVILLARVASAYGTQLYNVKMERFEDSDETSAYMLSFDDSREADGRKTVFVRNYGNNVFVTISGKVYYSDATRWYFLDINY